MLTFCQSHRKTRLNTLHVIVMPYHMAESIGEIHLIESVIFKQLRGKDIIKDDIGKIKKGLKNYAA